MPRKYEKADRQQKMLFSKVHAEGGDSAFHLELDISLAQRTEDILGPYDDVKTYAAHCWMARTILPKMQNVDLNYEINQL